MRLTVNLQQEKTELPLSLGANNAGLDASFGQCQFITEKNYEQLENLPSLDGETIIGNVREKDPTVPDWAKRPTKPSYTAQDIGAVAAADMQPLTAADLEIMWESFK